MSEAEQWPSAGERLSDLLREWLDRGIDRPLFERLRRSLGAVVAAELRRRGLYAGSPRFLGIAGNRWHEPGDPQGGSMEELVSQVFLATILQRLAHWRALLADRTANLEAALVTAIRHAIHELHRRNDPLGYALYQRAREAVEKALEAGELFRVDEGDGKIGNAAIFAAVPGSSAEPAPPAELAARIPSWLDELLPDLVTAVREPRRQVVGRLRARLADLGRQGIAVWSFKDLIDPLKAEVQARWQPRGGGEEELAFEEGEDDLPRLVRAVQPRSPDRIEREHLDQLLDCIARELDRHPAQQRTRDHCWTLWGYLGTHVRPASEDESLPSARELERLLKIPREKIPSLLETLGRFLRFCQKHLSRSALLPRLAGGGSPR